MAEFNFKEYARQMRENAVKDSDGVIRCSPELWEQIASIVENTPTADVAEVVRCPECIYCENMKCTELRDNSGHPLDIAIFDYCSQGVRR